MRLACALTLVLAAGAGAKPREYERVTDKDCWHAPDYKYLETPGMVSEAECRAACDKRDVCNLIYQYRYIHEADHRMCYMMEEQQSCIPGSPPPPDPGFGQWEAWRSVPAIGTRPTDDDAPSS